MAVEGETSKARLDSLVLPHLDDLTSIAALEEAMEKIRAQDAESRSNFKEQYAQYKKERDVLLPQKIADLVKENESIKIEMFSSMAPISRAANMSLMLDSRGQNMPLDIPVLAQTIRSFADRLEGMTDFVAEFSKGEGPLNQLLTWFQRENKVFPDPEGFGRLQIDEAEAWKLLQHDKIHYLPIKELFKCSLDHLEAMEKRLPRISRVGELHRKQSASLQGPMHDSRDSSSLLGNALSGPKASARTAGQPQHPRDQTRNETGLHHTRGSSRGSSRGGSRGGRPYSSRNRSHSPLTQEPPSTPPHQIAEQLTSPPQMQQGYRSPRRRGDVPSVAPTPPNRRIPSPKLNRTSLRGYIGNLQPNASDGNAYEEEAKDNEEEQVQGQEDPNDGADYMGRYSGHDSSSDHVDEEEQVQGQEDPNDGADSMNHYLGHGSPSDHANEEEQVQGQEDPNDGADSMNRYLGHGSPSDHVDGEEPLF